MALDPRRIVETLCPELYSSPSLNMYLDMAVELTDRGFFGKTWNFAIAYRACHLFTIADGGAGTAASGLGKVKSMSEGGVSVTYETGGEGSASNGMDTTKYGKLLMSLIKSRPTMGANTAGLHTGV